MLQNQDVPCTRPMTTDSFDERRVSSSNDVGGDNHHETSDGREEEDFKVVEEYCGYSRLRPDDIFQLSREDISKIFVVLDLKKLYTLGYSLIYDLDSETVSFQKSDHLMYIYDVVLYNGNVLPLKSLCTYSMLKILHEPLSP